MKELISNGFNFKSPKSSNLSTDDDASSKSQSRPISNRIARITHNILQKFRRTKSLHKLPKPEPKVKIGDTRSSLFSPNSESSQRSKSRKLLSPFEPRETAGSRQDFVNNPYGRFKEQLPVDRFKKYHVPHKIKSSNSFNDKQILFSPSSSDDGFHDASTWIFSDGSSRKRDDDSNSMDSFDEPSIHSFSSGSDTLDSISSGILSSSSRPVTTKTPITTRASNKNETIQDNEPLVLSLPLSLPNLKIQHQQQAEEQDVVNANPPADLTLDKELQDLHSELGGLMVDIHESLAIFKTRIQNDKERPLSSSRSESRSKYSESSSDSSSSSSSSEDEYKPSGFVVNKEKFKKLKENFKTKKMGIHERLRLAYKPDDLKTSPTTLPERSDVLSSSGLFTPDLETPKSKLSAFDITDLETPVTPLTPKISGYDTADLQTRKSQIASYDTSDFETPFKSKVSLDDYALLRKIQSKISSWNVPDSERFVTASEDDLFSEEGFDTGKVKAPKPTYLDKATKTKKLIPKGPSRREIWKHRKCGLGKFYEDPELMQQINDHIRKNALNVIRMPRKVPIPKYIDHYDGTSRLLLESGLARNYVYKPTYGKVPNYIIERKRKAMMKLQRQSNGDGDAGDGYNNCDCNCSNLPVLSGPCENRTENQHPCPEHRQTRKIGAETLCQNGMRKCRSCYPMISGQR